MVRFIIGSVCPIALRVEDRFFCLTEAPNKDAVQKHHSNHGFNCEWITEVKTTA
ncbi:MAG: DUF4242 domain-containing protein [Thermoproteota archaeon]|nr:DUF4242 domain-containing protein [Thermoproteota archaeon]